MNTLWQTDTFSYQLHRFPKDNHHPSLQAWDSADEYIVNYVSQHLDTITTPVILNDNFGAISVALNQTKPILISDSYITQQAVQLNCDENQLPCPQIFSSLDPLPNSTVYLLKLTKNIGYLEYQLEQLAQLPFDCQVIATGKVTQVTKNVMALFERYLSDVSSSLAKKKSRLIFAQHKADASNSQNLKSKYPVSVVWPEQDITLTAHANVYSKDQLDIGGRFLAENLPQIKPNQEVLDLGCGNGLLGLAVLKQAQQQGIDVKVTFVDESIMALESAKANVELNFPELTENCQFVLDDCLTKQLDESVDVILCNPPFHQQNTITDHIAKQMLEQSYQKLKSNGCLYVVANHHLAYPAQLKQLFGGFKVAAENKKFAIYKSIKR